MILLQLLASPIALGAADRGHAETVEWWLGVKEGVAEYRQQLRSLYAEVSAGLKNDRSRIDIDFGRRLVHDYPGSRMAGDLSGTFAPNGYTVLHFERGLVITRLTQRFGRLVKRYDLRADTFSISDGTNRVAFRLDLGRPEKSLFTDAYIPAISAAAENLLQRRHPPAWSPLPFRDILNHAYAHHISPTDGTRMDLLAEQLLAYSSTRDYVLKTAVWLYDTESSSTGGVSGGLGAVSSLNSPSRFLRGFQSIPGYALFLLFGAVAFPAFYVWKKAFRGRRSEPRRPLPLPQPEVEEENRFERNHAVDNAGQDVQAPEHFPSQGPNSAVFRAFEESLQFAIDASIYRLDCNVPLADLLGNRLPDVNLETDRQAVDFVITVRDSGGVVGVIQMDDYFPGPWDSMARDEEFDRALEGAGIPVLRCPCHPGYSAEDLKDDLFLKFGIDSYGLQKVETAWS